MLRCRGHLDEKTSVKSVTDRLAKIRDGVKGDKAIVDVVYDGPVSLPKTFFVKFAIGRLSAMRLLCVTSEVTECEALFYHHLAADCPVRTPRCYYADYNEATSEFILVSEHVAFGSGRVRPLKHRVRDAPILSEHLKMVDAGCAIHCAFWGDAALTKGLVRRYDATHRRAWPLMQVLSALGLSATARGQFKGRSLKPLTPFATWEAPAALVGQEWTLIRDMPHILTSLCEEVAMTAYGHNDIVTDNIFFDGNVLGLFDWQQACVNSVGQEWAWNFHFLPPEFLTAHEETLLDAIVAGYAAKGRMVARADLVRHYVLGCAQMYCFSGGGLQALMKRLHGKGLLATWQPDDARTRDGSLAHDAPTLELAVGAEMSRRAFTNVCNIMRRHDFAGEWRRWREARGMGEP